MMRWLSIGPRQLRIEVGLYPRDFSAHRLRNSQWSLPLPAASWRLGDTPSVIQQGHASCIHGVYRAITAFHTTFYWQYRDSPLIRHPDAYVHQCIRACTFFVTVSLSTNLGVRRYLIEWDIELLYSSRIETTSLDAKTSEMLLLSYT